MVSSLSEISDNGEYVRFARTLRDIAQERGQDAAVKLIDRAVSELSRRKLSLAVLGMVKRGKSTFCNALLGAESDEYAPVGKTPVSNAITIFEQGEPGVEVRYFDGTARRISLEQVPCYVTERLNPGNQLNVESIRIANRFPRLPEDVFLVDTPGEGSLHRHHDELLYRYLPCVDAAVFLITVHSPLTESELQFLKEVYANGIRRVFFAINRAEQADAEELQQAMQHNLSVLSANGIDVPAIYPVSARLALAGQWEESGLAALFADIKAYLDREKHRDHRMRFMERVMSVVAPLAKGISDEISARTRSTGELSKEIAALKARRKTLEAEQNEYAMRLKKAWNAAERDLFANIESALRRIETELSAYIQSASILSAINLKRNFTARFSQSVKSALYSEFDAFERLVNGVLASLPVSFHGLHIDLGLSEAEALFAGGTFCGKGKAVLTGLMVALGCFFTPVFAMAADVCLHSMITGRADLQRQLPAIMQQMRSALRAQRGGLAVQLDELLENLDGHFQLELSPTVRALQDALESHGTIDRAYDERLAVLQGMVASVGRQGKELQNGLMMR